MAPAHAYAADGAYTVTLTVTDATGAASTPATTSATIANVPPTVNAGPDAAMMAGVYTQWATFSDPGTGDAPWTYTIDLGGRSEYPRLDLEPGCDHGEPSLPGAGDYRVRLTPSRTRTAARARTTWR